MADYHLGHLERLRAGIGVLLLPIQYLVDTPMRAIDWVKTTTQSRKQLLEENQSLKKAQLLQQAKTLRYESLESENKRLHKLLQSSTTIGKRFLIARVLQLEANTLKKRITINKGSHHRVFFGQTVIDANGIVGQVIHTGPLTSVVMLITDPDHAIPVQFVNSGIRAIAFGNPTDNQLKLPHLTSNIDIKHGDLLVTSGLGGRFPSGYPVATITQIQQEPNKAFTYAYATPNAHLDRIREVLLIWNPQQQSMSSTQDQ